MDDKPSLFSSRNLGGIEKVKITSKQRIISQISHSWDNILQTLILDWIMDLLELDAFSSQKPAQMKILTKAVKKQP